MTERHRINERERERDDNVFCDTMMSSTFWTFSFSHHHHHNNLSSNTTLRATCKQNCRTEIKFQLNSISQNQVFNSTSCTFGGWCLLASSMSAEQQKRVLKLIYEAITRGQIWVLCVSPYPNRLESFTNCRVEIESDQRLQTRLSHMNLIRGS